MDNKVVLLVDDMPERGDAVQELVACLGYQVVRCSTAEECQQLLVTSPSSFRYLLANVHLEDGPLLPLIEGVYQVTSEPLPTLFLWSEDGELNLTGYGDFLAEQCALVFHLPLDVELLTRVIRLLRNQQDSLATSCSMKRKTGQPQLQTPTSAVNCSPL